MPARLLPQLADTAELVAFARTLPGLSVSVLVPNLRGAQDAIASGAGLMVVPLSASHAHSRPTCARPRTRWSRRWPTCARRATRPVRAR